MREVVKLQMKLDEVDISEIKLDLRSRDEIPKLLKGLQHIYCEVELRSKLFDTLEELIPKGVNPDNGRPGMELWKILVLGTLRLNCNWDYDKLQEIANNHKILRQILGHGIFDENYYALQTLKDNISLFTPEILDKINQLVVKEGHKVLGKEEESIRSNIDSFVVETDVHYPTDINLLYDAIRKVVELIKRECLEAGIGGCRQFKHLLKKIKKLFTKIRKLKRSNSKNEEKKDTRERLIQEAHKEYIEEVKRLLEKAKESLEKLNKIEVLKSGKKVQEIEKYKGYAEKLIDQIRRRVINGEEIAHEEKIFSIFEEDTEWISKGKAGVPQELGKRVCILKDSDGFILHHLVMEKKTDDKVGVQIVEEGKERFPKIDSCSFDKGFYSLENKKRLEEIIEEVILPKKGKLSKEERERETSEEFIVGRRKHSAVESAINALENHGLDRCLDRGIEGFKRYVALAVLGRNIQLLGHIIQQKELNRQRRREKFLQARRYIERLPVAA